jgi:glycosyltransferase involved in cell wall biosynthesis
VVCSNAGALTEVAGDAALTHAPEDDEALESHVASLLNDTALRDRLVAAGIERAGGFTWDRCAEETLRAYREVAG